MINGAIRLDSVIKMGEAGIHKKGEIGFPEILSKFEESIGGKDGAISSFIGLVREEGKKGDKVKHLHYECSDKASEELKKIADEIEGERGISRVAIHHFIDDLKPGDEIVYVLVSGEHRREVSNALPRIMNRLKSEVTIWKKEITVEGGYWIHEV